MAEFIIKAVDATHPNPIKDERGCYKRGDIVGVMPDGWQWGTQEVIPPAQGGKFVIVKIPGIDPERAKKYMAARLTTFVSPIDGNIYTVTQTRRLYRIRVDDVPANIRSQLNLNGTVTLTWTQVRDFIRNKLTDSDETGIEAP